MSSAEHIILYIFLFILFIAWGKRNYNFNSNIQYWKLALIPILAYILIIGSRYGWGPDYLSYKDRFEHAFSYQEDQQGFKFLNQGMNSIGLNYIGAYIIYSLIFVTCAFMFIRSFGAEAKYMYAFFLPATLILTTSAIRQGIALSFVLLAWYYFDKRKWILFGLSILIGASIHTTILLTTAMIGMFYFSRKWLINWKVSIPLYLFFTFVFDVSKIGVLSRYISTLSVESHFQSYIENADTWFGKEAASDIYEQSIDALILSALFHVSIIYSGYITLKYRLNERLIWIYNVTVFGLIFDRAVFYFEILRRIAEPLMMFYFVVLGYVTLMYFNRNVIKQVALFNGSSVAKTNRTMYFFNMSIFTIMIYLLLFWGRFIFLSPDHLFFWNL
ncbi:EpsG family protein [Mucilaginibacter calamicampi]|uniref:EpsG family protein n=1 Tax=Mucilaginibacter calamicampi TaxID=1302352 RepID=A0ABW2YX62_9SPHI